VAEPSVAATSITAPKAIAETSHLLAAAALTQGLAVALRLHCKSRLPAHERPVQYVVLAALPLTHNGILRMLFSQISFATLEILIRLEIL
jgi:hypothetical protein